MTTDTTHTGDPADTRQTDEAAPTEQHDGSAVGDDVTPGAGAGADPSASDGGGRRGVHRLRDLDRSGRLAASLIAAALLVAPVLALVHYLPTWVPSQDPAMMALRALDVGTSHTPLVGQPSLAHLYVEDNTVHHLGPIHFYLLAPFVRLLGAQAGMLVVSVLITGSCLLVTAWAVFRQLGASAGVAAAVVLGAVTYTTGASSLANPVSSNIAGYPLFCSAVLLWCLMCGDLRLLPLTTAVVSFTAQQHLSVVPALGVVTVAGVAGLVVAVLRTSAEDRPARRDLVRWGGASAGIGFALWLPVLLQQVVGTTPNLSRVARFAVTDDRPTLGFAAGGRQVVHVLGLPPVLGQHNINAHWLNEDVPLVTWLTAGAVVTIAVLAAMRWRRSQPRGSLLVVMAGVLAAAGLLNGSSVPTGTYETYRLAFYHWIFPLTFFATLVVVLAAVGLVPRRPVRGRPWVPIAVVGVAVVAIAAPNLANTFQEDRWLNTSLAAFSPLDRATVDELADEVMEQRDELDGSVMLIARGQSRDWGYGQAVALALEERGLRVDQPQYEAMFVAEGRWAHRSTVDAGLVVMLDTRTEDLNILSLPQEAPAIAEVRLPADFERAAFDAVGRLAEQPRRLRVFLLDREQLLDWVTDDELFD